MNAHRSDDDDEALAELADTILNLARKLALRGQDSREIIPLTGTEVEVIREVHRSPLSTPTQVAAMTGLRRSNVSVAIRVLESRGLITREHPADDARSVQLLATELADENMQRIRRLWASRLREVPEKVLKDSVGARHALKLLEQSLAR